MEPTPKLKVSFKLFMLNTLGAVLAALGIVCLQGQGADGHPLVAEPRLGWVLLLVGGLLMVCFMVDIFKRIRARQ